MKSFLLKAFFFLGTVVITFLALEWIPSAEQIGHRPWEAMLIQNAALFNGPFYPNQDLSMAAVGDLGHHTDKAVVKKVHWHTDHLGYRNDTFYQDPDVVLLGFSNIAGSSLDQNEMLSTRLSQASGMKVNNLGPNDYVGYLAFMRKKLFQNPPKVIVLGCIERRIPALSRIPGAFFSDAPFSKIQQFKNQIALLRAHGTVQPIAVGTDKVIRHNTINFLRARVKGSQGKGIPSPVDPQMLFYTGEKALLEPADSLAKVHAKTITTYARHAESQGIRFVFFPIPNKETAYFEKVPFPQQPSYLNDLHTALQDSQVTSIPTLRIYNQYLSSSPQRDEILYHTDDSHWGPMGVELVAQALLPLLKP